MLVESVDSRFFRQIPLFGKDGQEKLGNARVLLAGVGGLGSVIATYLAFAGVGYIRVVDEDVVNISNLNRQILYRERDVGVCKVDAAARMICSFNRSIEVDAVCQHIDDTTVGDLTCGMDLIVDGLDNFASRYVLNHASLRENIPFVHGAVNGFCGQVTTLVPGTTPCLRCIFPTMADCGTGAVVGATCGVIGCIEATEVIKYLTGIGKLLANRLLLWDGLMCETESIGIMNSLNCKDCGAWRFGV